MIISTIQLRRVLVNYFNQSELQNLAFDLKVDYENLPGQSKGDKARELIAYFERRKRLSELIHEIQQTRPDVMMNNGRIHNSEGKSLGISDHLSPALDESCDDEIIVEQFKKELKQLQEYKRRISQLLTYKQHDNKYKSWIYDVCLLEKEVFITSQKTASNKTLDNDKREKQMTHFRTLSNTIKFM